MIRLHGTGYLGLQRHPRYTEMVAQAQRTWGVNNPLSRNNPGLFAPLEAAESLLAERWETHFSRLLPNGFLAGMVMRACAAANGQPIWIDPHGHACFQQPKDAAAEARAPMEAPYGMILDAADPITGHPRWRTDPVLAERLAGADWAALDVSHVAELWEPRELRAVWRLPWERTVVFGSLGKAAAFPAGFVAGPERWLSGVERHPAFTAAAPPANALAEAFVDSQVLRGTLRADLSVAWADLLHRLGWVLPEPRLPVVELDLGATQHAALLDAGIAVGALAYPDPAGRVRYRCAFHAALSPDERRKITQEFSRLNLKPL